MGAIEPQRATVNARMAKPLEKTVRASDAKITPFLSEIQLEKLQQLRKEQKEELKRMITEEGPGKQN